MNYYTILGVTKYSSLYDIKKAYRKLALQYHPDKVMNSSLKKEYEEKFKQISEAYQVLSNPESRKQYDLLGNNFTNINMEFISPKKLFVFLFPDIDENTLSLIDHLIDDFAAKKKFSEIIHDFPYQKISKNQINKVFSYVKKFTHSWFQKKSNKKETSYQNDLQIPKKIQQSKPITITLKVTLEDIYNKNNKLVFIPIMKQCYKCTENKQDNCEVCLGKIFYCDTLTLSIPVYKQSKLIYSNKGHEVDFYKPGNIIIVIKQLKHSIYKRN